MQASLRFLTPLLLALLTLASCDHEPPEEVRMSLSVRYTLNGAPLSLGNPVHTSEDGLTYQIDDFKLYLSNFQLTSGTTTFAEPNSYHLISTSQRFIDVDNIPLEALGTFQFSIGVDSAANASLDAPGDLNPSNDMAWNWNTGYKFLLLEGQIQTDSTPAPLVYHIGGNANYTTLSIPLNLDLDYVPSDFFDIELTLELGELFRNPNTITFGEANVVQFEPTAELVAENWQTGFVKAGFIDWWREE